MTYLLLLLVIFWKVNGLYSSLALLQLHMVHLIATFTILHVEQMVQICLLKVEACYLYIWSIKMNDVFSGASVHELYAVLFLHDEYFGRVKL